jgi:hypothetical protein
MKLRRTMIAMIYVHIINKSGREALPTSFKAHNEEMEI